MEKNVAIGNIELLARQRNLFLLLTLLLCLSSVLLTIKVVMRDEKIILVPGIAQEVWTKNGGVSKGYLEETSLMYLPLLLDLNPEIIDYNAGAIFKYISQSEDKYMKKIQSYFADCKEKYKKFGLSTYFATKNLEVDSKNLIVIANGSLASRFGDRGFETRLASYQLSFEWVGGRLRLKEFIRIKDKDELEEEAKFKEEKEGK